MDEKTITLRFSRTQRNVLLKYIDNFEDVELAKLLSLALKKDDAYKIDLTKEQLQDLCDELCTMANNAKQQEIQEQLDELCYYLEDHMAEFDDEDETDEMDEDDEK